MSVISAFNDLPALSTAARSGTLRAAQPLAATSSITLARTSEQAPGAVANTGTAQNPSDQGGGRAANQAATVQLSREAQSLVNQLQATDRKVRAHELAHLAASGGLATSAPSYTYQRGPDGVSYAVGGEVSIDTSAGRTPEETLAKAEQVIAAALAPADPSGADQAVAAAASQRAQQARAQILAEQIQAANPDANAGAGSGANQGIRQNNAQNAAQSSIQDSAQDNIQNNASSGSNRPDRTAAIEKSYGSNASDVTGLVIAAQSQRIDSYA